MNMRDWLASRLSGYQPGAQPSGSVGPTPGGAMYPRWYGGPRGGNTLYQPHEIPPRPEPQPSQRVVGGEYRPIRGGVFHKPEGSGSFQAMPGNQHTTPLGWQQGRWQPNAKK
jgi:hypothetical protein